MTTPRAATKKRTNPIDSLDKIDVPPQFPKKIPPSRKVVFVDPDDTEAPWWWPALVVPKAELKLFMSTVEGEMEEPGPGQLLVCYFEDGSFSIVPESDTIPFCPYRPPYTTYALGPNYRNFRNDKAIILATLYWETGIVPQSFAWLRNQPQEERQHLETVSLWEVLDGMKKRCIRLFDEIMAFRSQARGRASLSASEQGPSPLEVTEVVPLSVPQAVPMEEDVMESKALEVTPEEPAEHDQEVQGTQEALIDTRRDEEMVEAPKVTLLPIVEEIKMEEDAMEAQVPKVTTEEPVEHSQDVQETSVSPTEAQPESYSTTELAQPVDQEISEDHQPSTTGDDPSMEECVMENVIQQTSHESMVQPEFTEATVKEDTELSAVMESSEQEEIEKTFPVLDPGEVSFVDETPMAEPKSMEMDVVHAEVMHLTHVTQDVNSRKNDSMDMTEEQPDS